MEHRGRTMTTLEAKAIEYPSGDGQPMAETGIHVVAIVALLEQLMHYYAQREDVYVIGDIFWYYEEGNPNSRVAPDVMVIPGVPKEPHRRSFFSWREQAIPALVVEFASKSTWQDDLEDKYDLYERLGVREYFLFDPEGLYLLPSLQGYRLKGSTYRRIRATNGVVPTELGIGFQAEDTTLRMVDLKTGERILSGTEAFKAEKTRAENLQSEVERLQALLQKYGHANGNGS
jgi:Uma2 family endonuclease